MADLPSQSNSPLPELRDSFEPDAGPVQKSVAPEENKKKAGSKLSFAPPLLERRDSKRASIQFSLPDLKAQAKPQSDTVASAPKLIRRASSPPPAKYVLRKPTANSMLTGHFRTYSRGVSFDTFDNRDATDYMFTLNYKHKNYNHTRRSRTFLCGTDQKDYSEFALEWLLDELVDDGDEIVCLRAIEKDSKLALDLALDKSKYRAEAHKILDHVIEKNGQDEKAISVVLELAMGKVQDIIQRMVGVVPKILALGLRFLDTHI